MINSERLRRMFMELCAIDSESKGERQMADRLTEILTGLGFRVTEDDTGGKIGGSNSTSFDHVGPSRFNAIAAATAESSITTMTASQRPTKPIRMSPRPAFSGADHIPQGNARATAADPARIDPCRPGS